MNELLFRVVDNTLYSVPFLGAIKSLGEVTGDGRCIFEDDGDNLVIISDKVYVYTKSYTLIILFYSSLSTFLTIHPLYLLPLYKAHMMFLEPLPSFTKNVPSTEPKIETAPMIKGIQELRKGKPNIGLIVLC